MVTYHRTCTLCLYHHLCLTIFLFPLISSLIHELFKTTLVNMPILGKFSEYLLLLMQIYFMVYFCIFNIFECIETFFKKAYHKVHSWCMDYADCIFILTIRIIFLYVSAFAWSQNPCTFGVGLFLIFSELILIICRRYKCTVFTRIVQYVNSRIGARVIICS